MRKILICGDVDSGKSTLVGKFLKNNNNLFKNHNDSFYLITDTLSNERSGNKTIHSTTYYFDDLELINCPGHEEYLMDTISRFSEATEAILIIDSNTFMSDLTKLYKDLLEAFNLPYIILFNDKNIGSIDNKYFDVSLDILNKDIDEIVLSEKTSYSKDPNIFTTILFEDYNKSTPPVNLEGSKIIYNNGIVTKYDLTIPEKIVFYKDKRIVGCGL